ncbi:MAG TPA: transposase, partial [Candidatus Cybelea sp.]|nr:transposase [Candidatus Cybelea sp.]
MSNSQIRGFKYRFYPTPEQIEHLSKVFGHSRFVYNRLLAERKIARLTFSQACRRLTVLKTEHLWLKEVSSVPLQQTLRNQQRAFVNLAQKRAKFPTFKKKNNKQSASFVRTAFTYRNGVLALAKMGALQV